MRHVLLPELCAARTGQHRATIYPGSLNSRALPYVALLPEMNGKTAMKILTTRSRGDGLAGSEDSRKVIGFLTESSRASLCRGSDQAT